MKIAQIIVDVPLMQTDKPFSYKIPEEWESLFSIGIRVHVPFGRSNRLIQGIVVGVLDSESSSDTLKAVSEILDIDPVLTDKQLILADQMRKTVFSYKISILKAMLPNLLNSSYDRILVDKTGQEIRWSNLTETEQLVAAKRVRAHELTIRYTAESKENKKTEKWVSVIHREQLLLLEIGKGAKKRREAKDHLLSLKTPTRQKELPFSLAVLKYFIEEGYLKVEEREVSRTENVFSSVKNDKAKTLNAEQQKAFDEILSSSDKPFLLEGVTGSGKTEVYLQVIEKVISTGQTAIVLVPEISLTPLMTSRFIARFGQKVAIMHSGLSDGEKYDEWRKIKRGEASVVVGARSAIFSPLDNLGVIIIDEEHETSYKQDSSPRYHARDVALLRMKNEGAKLILGSATPSLETRARAERGVYKFLLLTQRANPLAQLPAVQIIDMKRHLNSQSANFSQPLLSAIKDRLDKKEQILLMLNRRGYSSFVMCRDCGYVVECPNCDISLTLHMDTRSLNCHYCGHQERIPDQCPNCQSKKISYYGSGTQKVEEELNNLLPNARVLRMDVDTTRKKNAHERILSAFEQGEADILLGTQMIAKGLDFPNVTLVGVINGDTGLNLPDFRSSERTFELLTQVAGRAGRAEKKGEVFIQTFNPNHYAIELVKTQNYEQFYKEEMLFRQKLAYPPYYYTVQVLISHREEELAMKKAYEIASLLRSNLTEKAKLLGPTPRPIARTHQLYHYQILVKYRFEEGLGHALEDILTSSMKPENKELRIVIDHEPQNLA